MIDRVTPKLYAASGDRYWLVLVAGEGGVSAVIAMVTVALVALYFEPPVSAAALVMGCGVVLTVLAVFYAAVRARPTLDTVRSWRRIECATAAETVAAWTAATSFTFHQYRRHTVTVTVIAAVPTCALAAHFWDLGWPEFGAMILACIVPSAYATVLSYSLGELLAKPLVEEIALALPDDFPFGAENLPSAGGCGSRHRPIRRGRRCSSSACWVIRGVPATWSSRLSYPSSSVSPCRTS